MNTDDEIEAAFLAGFKAAALKIAGFIQEEMKAFESFVYDDEDIGVAEEEYEKWLSKTKT